MNWGKNCFALLDARRMFENHGHRTRFKELLDCYSDAPFFTKGLCKCMYLSAWDEKHFVIMLEMLTDLTLGNEKDTSDMRENGDVLAEQQKDAEYYVYQLSNAFLDDSPFQLDKDADIDDETRHIIRRGLIAAAIIDEV